MTTDDTGKRPARDVLLALIVLGIALTLRLLNVFFIERYNPLAGDLQLDAATYDGWARSLAFGGGAGSTNLMQAPLYPWLLALVYRIFGPTPAAIRLVQAVIGTLTVGLIMLCTRRFFKSAAASILAGILGALYAPFIFEEGVLVPATLIAFLNILFVAALFTEEEPRAARLLVSGLVLGLAVDANPPALIILPFVLLHLFLTARTADVISPHAASAAVPASAGVAARRRDAAASHERPAGRSPGAFSLFTTRSLILAAGLIIALAPVTIRNWFHGGEFIPLTTGGGINFYIGNNPDANGFYSMPYFKGKSIGATAEEQMRNMREIAFAEAGRSLSPSGVSKFWFDAGLDYVRGNPGAWAALLWKKFQFFWNDYERANVENFYFCRRFPGILRLRLLSFGVIAPLGLLGIFLTRTRWRSLWVLYGGVVTYLLVALVFYVLARYRLPVVPFLLVFAGAAVVELLTLARHRRFLELALSVAALGLLAIFSNITVARDTPYGTSNTLARLGNAYMARGDTTSAEKAYREALELNAKNASAKAGLMRIISKE